MTNFMAALGNFFESYGDLTIVLTIFVLATVAMLRPYRRTLSLLVIGEQCMTYLMFYAFYEFPFMLKSCLGIFYLAICVWVGLIASDLSSRIISKIYFGVGIYHFLLALEPLVIKYLFSGNPNVIEYMNSAHLLINVSANLAILGFVVFGGYGGGSRKRSIFDNSFSSSQFVDSNRHQTAHKN